MLLYTHRPVNHWNIFNKECINEYRDMVIIWVQIWFLGGGLTPHSTNWLSYKSIPLVTANTVSQSLQAKETKIKHTYTLYKLSHNSLAKLACDFFVFTCLRIAISSITPPFALLSSTISSPNLTLACCRVSSRLVPTTITYQGRGETHRHMTELNSRVFETYVKFW